MAQVWKLLVTSHHPEKIDEILTKAGAGAIATTPVETGFENKNLSAEKDPLEEKGPVLIEAYFGHQPVLGELAAQFPAHQDLSLEILPDIDWVAESQKNLPIVLAPPFALYGQHDREKSPHGLIGIEIEAGAAFGSGHHGTTQGCLVMLGRVLKATRPEAMARMLDLGCGSGVLAIALAKATRKPVLASDVDSVAVAVTRQNTAINRLGGLVTTITADGLHNPRLQQGRPYDLIVANILARPLQDMAPQLARALTPGGHLVLSGLLTHQSRQVRAAMRLQNLRFIAALTLGEWTTLWLRR